MSPHLAVFIALGTPVLFAMRNVWVKVSKIKGEMNPSNLTLASSSLVSIILVILSFILLPIEEFGKEIFFRMLIASFCSIVALMFLSNAMASGYSGPVSALGNIQPIVHTTLNAIFLSEIPTWLQIVGLALGTIGAIVIALGPMF